MQPNKFSRGVVKDVATAMNIKLPAAYQRIYTLQNPDALRLAIKFEKVRQAEKAKIQKELEKLKHN